MYFIVLRFLAHMGMKDFIADMENKVKDIGTEMDRISEKAENDQRSRERLGELRGKRNSLQAKLEEMRASGEEGWIDMKHDIEKAWRDLKTELEKATT